MGSQSYQERYKGPDIETAFAKAQADADDEYGHQQGYSGQINMACGVSDVTQKYKNSKKSLDEFINDELHKTSKHNPAQALCMIKPIGNKNQIKSQVEHNVVNGTKKWITYHVVYVNGRERHRIGKKLTKGAAVELARRHTSRTQEETEVVLEKRLENKKARLEATITYKKASDEREGEWVFYGWASS
jgi:hypothetical protein